MTGDLGAATQQVRYSCSLTFAGPRLTSGDTAAPARLDIRRLYPRVLRTFTFLRALAGLVCPLKPRLPVLACAFLASAIRRDGITALSTFPGSEAGGLFLGRDVPGAFGVAVEVRERKSPIRSCERRSRFSGSSRFPCNNIR